MKWFAWPMTVATSVASTSRGRCPLKERADVLRFSGWNHNELAAAWANETQEASTLDQGGYHIGICGAAGREQLNQQMHRDVKRLHTSLPSNLQT